MWGVLLAGLVAGCTSDSGTGSDAGPDAWDPVGDGGADLAAPSGDAGGAGAGDGSGLATDSASEAGDAGSGIDQAPALPGTVTFRIVNETEADFKFPDDTRFRVWVVGAPEVTTEVAKANGGYEATLVVPAGPQMLRLQELAADGTESIDYFQEATRTVPVTVLSADNVEVEFHLKWHWEPHQVFGSDGAPSCRGVRQVHFWDQNHGIITVAQEANTVANYPHASALTTEDGGLSWQVSTELMLANPMNVFKPASGNWFNNRHLLLLADGKTALSIGDSSAGTPIARTADGGKTWTLVPFSAPTWGPGGIQYAGIVSSGPFLYLPAETGGVQGSSQRTSLSRSLDGGKTFQVILDRCDRGEDVSCGNALQPTLPLGFAGIDFGCGPAGHCISLGPEAVLTTTEHFDTYKILPSRPPEFGCGGSQSSGRVVWLPGTKTAWLIVPNSNCFGAQPIRRVSTDGGVTWGDWEPSPASAGGYLAFADADNGFSLEVRDLRVTHDGGKTFRSTGPAPRQSGSAEGFRLTVLDAEHAWVTSSTERSCELGPFSYIARWRK